MMSVLMDTVVSTDYGQFTLVQGGESFDGDADRFFAGQVNGWVGAGVPGVVHIVLARRSGGSEVRIERWEEEPPLDDWEDVVEVSTVFRPNSPIGWETWAGESAGSLPIPSGSYRVRVSAEGRDAGTNGEFTDGVVDRYLIQLRLAPRALDEVLRVSSADASYWNEVWGRRRK